MAKQKGLFSNSFFSGGGDSDAWLARQKKLRQSGEEQQQSASEQAKAEADKAAVVQKADDDAKKSHGLGAVLGGVGNFIKDAAVDVKDTTVDAFKGTKTMIDSIGANARTNERTKLQQQNSKEFSDYMNSILGDAVDANDPRVKDKWDSPEVQEKFKEFRYKGDLLSGKTPPPEDIPESAKKAQQVALDAHKNNTIGIDGTSSLLTKDPKTGKLQVNATPVDPYQKYRDAAATIQQDQKTGEDLQKLDAKKLAAQDAETFLNVATLGLGTAPKQLLKEGVIVGGKELLEQGAKETGKQVLKNVVGSTGKEFAGNIAKDAAIGGAYGYTSDIRNRAKEDTSLAPDAKNILIGATVGAGVPIAGKGLQKFTGVADKKAGQIVSDIGIKTLDKSEASGSTLAEAHTNMRKALNQIGTDGIFGTLDKAVSRAGKAVGYKVGDALKSTKPGVAVAGLQEDFMKKWVTNFAPVYSRLKRSDFDGRTTGAYEAARNLIGDANRATSFAQDFVDNNAHTQQLAASLAAMPSADIQKNLSRFDEFAKQRSELDLHEAGAKKFTKGKIDDVNARMAAFSPEEQSGMHEMYKSMVNAYSDLNDFRLENGLITKETHQAFKDDPFDYVRVQRELPDWLQDKNKGQGAGSKAAISGTTATMKRTAHAEQEQLSPVETLMKSIQVAHVEAYRAKAAHGIYNLLNEAGEATLERSSDMVKAKNELLSSLKASKPIVTKLDRTVRTDKKAAGRLAGQMNQLSKEGLDISLKRTAADDVPQAFRYVNKTVVKNAQRVSNPTKRDIGAAREITGQVEDHLGIEGSANIPKMIKAMVTEDPARLKQIRKMLESRDEKLTPLLDSIENMNRDLHDLHTQRSGEWQEANGIKTTAVKKNRPTVSFLDEGIENVYKTDPAIASAINNWTGQQQNVINGFFRATNNIFKFGTTGGNIGFALPNVAGDVPSAFINSKNGKGFINPVTFLDSLYMTVTGKPMALGDRELFKNDAELLRGYNKANKGQTNINQYSKPADAKRLAQQFAGYDASAGEKLYTAIRHPLGIPRKVAETVDNLIAIGENTTRLQAKRAEYNRLLKKGVQHEEADRLSNQAARENSVDFQEMGEYGKMLNSFFPYFNATIQGSRTIMRNLGERPVTTAGKIGAVVGVPTVATTVWNTSDKKRNDIYKTIPDYVKENNYVIITPGASWNAEKKKWDGVVILKKPPGFAQFAEPARKYIEYKADGGDESLAGFLKDNAGNIGSDFAQAVQPIDFSNKWKFINSITPQALKPTLQAVINKNLYTGQDIVPGSMEDLAAKDQHYDDYSRLTGYFGSMFNVSPIQADAWIKNTFGELGTNAQHYIDKDLLRAPGHEQGGRSIEESITRRFSGAPGQQDQQAFYDSYNKASSARKIASAKVTELVKAGRVNEAKRRAEEYNDSISGRFNDFYKQYKDSPTYDTSWDDKVDNLPIKTTESAFKARRKVPQ